MRHQHLNGVWRARGADPSSPRTNHTLILMQKGGDVIGTDTHGRAILKGAVHRADGDLHAKGHFKREDGSLGSFSWSLARHGGTLAGAIAEVGGRPRRYEAVRQSVNVPKHLQKFLVKRRWGGGDGGLGEVSYSNLKVGGIPIGKVPTGYSAKGPGGSKIKVGRKGVSAKAPDVEQIIAEAAGVGGGKKKKAPPPDAGETEAAKSGAGFLKTTLIVAGSMLGAGVIAFALTAKR